jgi:small-conductance mechanosensitive channel
MNKTVAFGIFTICLLMSFQVLSQTAKVTVNQSRSIDKLMEFKRDIRTNTIYKIQIFQSTQPKLAEEALEDFKLKYQDWPTRIEFNTPNYKVWVGTFKDKLEADRALATIKQDYMYAFIFEPKTDFKQQQ